MGFTVRRKRGAGFTLIELLVVVLILAILMAVALPLYLSAVADSQRKTCRSNLQTIANAVQAARVAAVAADYSTWNGSTVAALVGAVPSQLPDLEATPVCPQAGTYAVAQGACAADTCYLISCTVHGTFEPGIDSQ